jgi:hypothetical protein
MSPSFRTVFVMGSWYASLYEKDINNMRKNHSLVIEKKVANA